MTTLAENVTTRWGTIDRVVREGDAIAFQFDALPDPQTSAYRRETHRARRAAVAWMASNPAKQRGVRVYRFDVGDVRDAF